MDGGEKRRLALTAPPFTHGALLGVSASALALALGLMQHHVGDGRPWPRCRNADRNCGTFDCSELL